jgi:hypothetical protein
VSQICSKSIITYLTMLNMLKSLQVPWMRQFSNRMFAQAMRNIEDDNVPVTPDLNGDLSQLDDGGNCLLHLHGKRSIDKANEVAGRRELTKKRRAENCPATATAKRIRLEKAAADNVSKFNSEDTAFSFITGKKCCSKKCVSVS